MSMNEVMIYPKKRKERGAGKKFVRGGTRSGLNFKRRSHAVLKGLHGASTSTTNEDMFFIGIGIRI